MICDYCEGEGHYWFANDDEPLDQETEDLIGIYAYCDMREVYRLSTPCQCGCHGRDKETVKVGRETATQVNVERQGGM